MWGVAVCFVMTFLTIYIMVRAIKSCNWNLVFFWGFVMVIWSFLSAVAVYGLLTFA